MAATSPLQGQTCSMKCFARYLSKTFYRGQRHGHRLTPLCGPRRVSRGGHAAWLEVVSHKDKKENELTLTALLDAAARCSALPRPLFTAAK